MPTRVTLLDLLTDLRSARHRDDVRRVTSKLALGLGESDEVRTEAQAFEDRCFMAALGVIPVASADLKAVVKACETLRFVDGLDETQEFAVAGIKAKLIEDGKAQLEVRNG
jgi:hypothetical protein